MSLLALLVLQVRMGATLETGYFARTLVHILLEILDGATSLEQEEGCVVVNERGDSLEVEVVVVLPAGDSSLSDEEIPLGVHQFSMGQPLRQEVQQS